MNRIDTDTAHRIWNAWITEHRHQAELLNPCDLIRMVEDELERCNQGMQPVVVGDLFIIDSGDSLWIGETHGGEGGEFSKDKFHEVLQKFYKDNF